MNSTNNVPYKNGYYCLPIKEVKTIKNFEESISYLAEKLDETWACIDDLKFQLSEKFKLANELQKKISTWKPKNKNDYT